MFQRIVGVHWPKKKDEDEGGPLGQGEIIFAMGDFETNACYVAGAQADDHGLLVPREVVPLNVLIEGGAIYASSCHVFRTGEVSRPVFLLGCDKHNPDNSTDSAIILASTDGRNWSTVYQYDPPTADNINGPSAWVFAIVWDDKAKSFYAGAHQWERVVKDLGDEGFTIDIVEHDILLSSSNGISWGRVGEQSFKTVADGENQGDPPWGDSGGLLVPHCRIDGIPDGFYYYSFDQNTEKEIHIRPDTTPWTDYGYGNVSYGNAPHDPPSTVLIDIKEGGSKVLSRTSSPGISNIQSLAYSGGAIIVVGGTEVPEFPFQGPDEFAVSYDLGQTWIRGSFTGRPPAVTVCGRN